MKHFIFLPLLFLVLSCGSEPQEQIAVDGGATYDTELDYFEGNYYMIEADKESGQYEMVENCWCKCVESFEFSEFAGSPGEHYFAINAHHSTMYLLQDYSKEEHKISFKGMLEDESSDELQSFELIDQQNNLWTLKTPFGDYELVKEEKKNEYPTKPCQEDVMEEDEYMNELDFQSELVKALWTLNEGGEQVNALIAPYAGVVYKSSAGINEPPIVETFSSADDVVGTGLFTTPVYKRLMEYVQMHHNEERSFITYVDELPDFCSPQEEGMFVRHDPLKLDQQIHVEVHLVKQDDENETFYTYLKLEFLWEGEMILTVIDHTDCGD